MTPFLLRIQWPTTICPVAGNIAYLNQAYLRVGSVSEGFFNGQGALESVDLYSAGGLQVENSPGRLVPSYNRSGVVGYFFGKSIRRAMISLPTYYIIARTKLI